MKRPYELPFVFRILSTDDETQTALDQVVSWIEGENNEYGNVTRIDRTRFGRRKLAYEIDGQRDGLYILISAEIDPSHLPELELNLKVFTPVLRYLVLRDEEAEAEARKGESEDEADEAEEETAADEPTSEEAESADEAEEAADDEVADEAEEEAAEADADESDEEDKEES
ncbi:MAG: hypothetical protein CL607_14190 [Anaerolineaceae bacterium]|nr:hypothetical protein [Anaerolineaceae bacterium]